MINIEKTQVWGFEGAIRGMRMPYESFNKSDSTLTRSFECTIEENYDNINHPLIFTSFLMGKNDLALCKKLIKGGSEHRKFLRMIHVQADVLAPRYWWAEMDTYKHVTMNSSSTMHLITKRELTLEDFELVNNGVRHELISYIIPRINEWINEYRSTSDNEHKNNILRSIKQLLPESYNQLRTIDTNYECLLNIYRQRKNHRLTEWHEFCSWIETLPYMKEFLA